ncbi:hypothetical protein ACOBR2_06720 [Telmatobacter bradus]|uniref:hypothetical protein n=1 Tax=Telmatobacter bradus TaxID=474953 RepID=UPI003B4340BA
MARDLPSLMVSSVGSNVVRPCFMLDLTLSTGVEHIWSGYSSISYAGCTYRGVAALGSVGAIAESSNVHASGMTVALSGIDNTLLTETLNDIQIGASCCLWLAAFANGAIQSRYCMFGGTVDQSNMQISPEVFDIALALETRMSNLQRASNRRYTLADQRSYYSDDSGFAWVERLNDIALQWG